MEKSVHFEMIYIMYQGQVNKIIIATRWKIILNESFISMN